MNDQLTRDDLKRMTPAAIDQAREDGLLDKVLGLPDEEVAVKAKARGTDPLTVEDVRTLARYNHHDLITAAYDAGRITQED